ncbi:uncharacterized protein LOC120070133 [Benincasa hispida]|uniref:uncharacterized protein LOC120070133 n=1 Tax=Benincasa hispida TaxID=102211 RepID=UPI00190205FD|nr:uncharacterized protein LOC120070133 [Benincasa hispida]
MDVVEFLCYMHGNIVNGPSGIEYDRQPSLRINMHRQDDFNTLIDGFYDAYSINRDDVVEVIFRYGSYVARSTFHIPISLRSDIDVQFMMSNAPYPPNRVELYISQPSVPSPTSTREEVETVELESHVVEDEHYDPTIATNDEEVKMDDDDIDLDQLSSQFYGVHEVPETFTEIDLNEMTTEPDSTTGEDSNMGSDSLLKGMIFNSKLDLKNVVENYSIIRHQNFEVIELKKTTWDVRLSQDHNRLNSDLIASEVSSIVKKKLSVDIKTLQDIILNSMVIPSVIGKVWDRRRNAIANIFGDWIESYNLLPKWMNILQITNPSTVVHWRLNKVDCDERIVMFTSVFWSFGPIIEGFKHCRPLLQIDGTYLYGKYEGTLLIATSIDANGHIYPVAYAIVLEESANSWVWFLRNLWDYVVHRREGMCLISNRHKGIISAVRNPNNDWVGLHQRFYLQHVASNFNDKYKNSLLKSFLYSEGSKFQVRKFNGYMAELQIANPNCLRYFSSIDPKQWTQTHDGGHHYG